MTSVTPAARIWRPLVATAIVVVGVGLAAWPRLDVLSRVGIDLMLPATAWLKASNKTTSTEIALVVIDEATHRRPPFNETPEIAWTPYMAEVLNAIGQSGAKVIGLDVIYPKTLAGPDLLPGFDRPFLTTLFNLGQDGRLLLGDVRLSSETIAPYEGQIQAVGGWNNVRPLNLTPDTDGVVRAYPASFGREDGTRVLSFANELVKRAGRVPVDVPFLIDFLDPSALPVYRLADIYQCAEKDPDSLPALFKDRIVIIGAWLDVEDRQAMANRFVDPDQPPVLDLACGTATTAASPIHRQRVPGVLAHALAARTILQISAPRELEATVKLAVLAVLLAGLATGFLLLPPLHGLAFLALAIAALWGGAVALFSNGLVVPYLLWGALAVAAYMLLYSYRVFIEDQQKRWIRHAFRHYLSPHLVDNLAAHPELLRLGGERRNVAVLFLDLAGFTALSERLAAVPETIVTLLNDQLGRIADLIEAHEGYVDKFVGDAVMAVWGAPAACVHPEMQAVAAALACRDALDAHAQGDGTPLTALRIGIAGGDVVAGNIGSNKRFNYTVIGDTVNLAARLESANRNYGTTILATEALIQRLDDSVVRRLVDRVIVAGRSEPVSIYEIIGFRAALGPTISAKLNAFTCARVLYLARDFEAACRSFGALANQDPVARLYAERAAAYDKTPPSINWDGTEVLTTK